MTLKWQELLLGKRVPMFEHAKFASLTACKSAKLSKANIAVSLALSYLPGTVHGILVE